MSDRNNNESSQRIMDGTAWDEFCELLKKAGKHIIDETSPEDPFDRAEGYRYLTRLTRAACETFLEGADPLAPELRRTAHETIKMGADNPDNYYMSAPIRGRHEYRITGQRGTVHYLGFGTQAGNYGATGSLNTTGYLEAADMEINPDGSFEMLVSVEEKAGNWLRMAPESRSLIVRQTFLDRKTETLADLRIERIDGPHAPRYLTARAVDHGLIGSGMFVDGCARLFAQWANGMKAHTNELPLFDPAVAKAAGGDPNILYHHSYWELAEDEALVIESPIPECDYWNFQLNNHWMESLDYRYFPITFNKHTAKLGPEGSVRLVISAENPGVENWVDTCGHVRGTMCWRWIRATDPPTPVTRVVKTASLGT
ncbi:MAG: hypothetical protein V3R77_09975 [Candidatus Binatia bacterium]